MAPGEAHNRLGIIERRHMVFRTACENYMDNENLERTKANVKEAVEYVAPVLNTLSFTKGYTPSQWVLNTNPQDQSNITADTYNPSTQHDALHDEDFAAELRRRISARQAFIKADADARIRRALLRRHRILRCPLQVGQKAYYWRHAGAPRLQKIDGKDHTR